MSGAADRITPFDRMNATGEQYRSVTELLNVISAEANPDDPPSTVENIRLQMQNIPPVYEFHAWASWDSSRAKAIASLIVPKMETNQHVVQFDISVLPEYRRQGLATAFLSKMAIVTEREGRRLCYRIPAAACPQPRSSWNRWVQPSVFRSAGMIC